MSEIDVEKLMNDVLNRKMVKKTAQQEGISEEDASKRMGKYFLELLKDPELCIKETGYTPTELTLMQEGYSEEEAKYLATHPCNDPGVYEIVGRMHRKRVK